MHTPGHSPDSIGILLEHNGKQKAVFSGDTLFIGDCGRPDLREGAGNIKATRLDLAKKMYHTLRDRFMPLNDDITLYPAHGAGTLCGKSLSKESSSTIAKEKQTNWSLQPMTENAFVKELLSDQPFIPAYFPFDVEINRKGAAGFQESISKISVTDIRGKNIIPNQHKTLWLIDTRKDAKFKAGHLPHSINLMEHGKFETWLGSIIKPGEKFYLGGENKEQLQRMIERTAAIGYESSLESAYIINGGSVTEEKLDITLFTKHPDNYTIVDVRNASEVKAHKVFPGSISIPLPELRNRIHEIATDKPIGVHCEGGYRSAAASSFIHSKLDGTACVFDLGEVVKLFAEK